MPPDMSTLDQFEQVLHNPVGIDYFFKYLEEMPNDQNSFRLLALYMDLRLFETSARKLKKCERLLDVIVVDNDMSISNENRNTQLFMSGVSGSSSTFSSINGKKMCNYQKDTLEIAERIFFEYLSLEA